MAGGPNARVVPCMVCLNDRLLTKATRTREGTETDHYACEKGHRFGMDFPKGPPAEPEWPPNAQLRAYANLN
jgi:hypothetical protein